ncbi:hypothetical protein T265_07763 [Opisthorchis viverrini]|uniref:Uncharacterized protein n=1 Tax=Opisthorchis viverrini TaxID=6198 RepID=A0A074ZMN5_OPIVI|nr:hypothetical protein T265_07763 [Opisthorchis viverrini]KER24620.1 hypothetical protein T265_07763 [Opisthorchis viverrini]
MQQSSALPTDWKCLMQTLTSVEKLIHLCMPYANKLFPMQNLLDNDFDQNLSNTIQTWMMNMIDFDALTIQHRFSVKQGLDPKLDECPALRTDDSVRHASVLRVASARHMVPTSSGIYKSVLKPRRPVYLAAFNVRTPKQAGKQAALALTLDSLGIDV